MRVDALVLRIPLSSPLRSRGYRLLWLGSTISLVGDSFQLVAFSVLVLRLTQSPADWGTVLMLQAIPAALLMLAGGAAADRFRPRSVLLAAHLLQALMVAALAGLTAAERLERWHLYLFAVAFGAAHAFVVPAIGSITPELVPPDRVRSANALSQMTANVARFLVPPLAGAVVAAAGTALAFTVNAASFAVSAGLLGPIPNPPREHPSPAPLLQQIREGLRVAREDAVVWLTIVLSTVFFFGQAGAMVGGLPALAKLTLDGGDRGVGLLYGAVGAGALLGTLFAGTASTIRRPALAAYLLTIGAGVTVTATGFVPSVWAAVPLLVLSGACYSSSGIIFVSMVQTRTRPNTRGRVMSLLALGMVGPTPLSYGAVALAGDLLGPRGIVALGGAFMALSGVIGISRKAVRGGN